MHLTAKRSELLQWADDAQEETENISHVSGCWARVVTQSVGRGGTGKVNVEAQSAGVGQKRQTRVLGVYSDVDLTRWSSPTNARRDVASRG